MRIIETTVYRYDELSEAAKAKAVERVRSDLSEYLEYDNLTEWMGEYLSERGLPSEDIRFSLSYCQGDGVAFYGEVDVPTLLRKYRVLSRYRSILDHVIVSLSPNSYGHHYSHWNTMQIDVEWACDREPTSLQELLLGELEDRILSIAQAESGELERRGYAEIDYLTSAEVAVETIECNEWEFTEDGGIV